MYVTDDRDAAGDRDDNDARHCKVHPLPGRGARFFRRARRQPTKSDSCASSAQASKRTAARLHNFGIWPHTPPALPPRPRPMPWFCRSSALVDEDAKNNKDAPFVFDDSPPSTPTSRSSRLSQASFDPDRAALFGTLMNVFDKDSLLARLRPFSLIAHLFDVSEAQVRPEWRCTFSCAGGTASLTKFLAALKLSCLGGATIVAIQSTVGATFGVVLVDSTTGMSLRGCTLWEVLEDGKIASYERTTGSPALMHAGLRSHWSVDGLRIGTDLAAGHAAKCPAYNLTHPLGGQVYFAVAHVQIWHVTWDVLPL